MRTKEELNQARWEKLIAIRRRGLLKQIAMLQKELDDLPTSPQESEQDFLRLLKSVGNKRVKGRRV